MADNTVNPEEFSKARDSAQGLAADMRDILFESRDLTDEVKKITKAIYGVSETAAQINASFKTMSRLEREIGAGIESIFDGSRKILHVEKDQLKFIKERKKLTQELKTLTGDSSTTRRLADEAAIMKKMESQSSILQQHSLQKIKDTGTSIALQRKELDAKLEEGNLSKKQLDSQLKKRSVLDEKEIQYKEDKLNLENKMLDNLSEEDKISLGKIKSEEDLIKILKQKIKSSDDVSKNLDKQLKILEKGETQLKKGLQGTADILKKIGLTNVAAPLEAAAEGARKAAIEGKDLKEQFRAAAFSAQKLVGEMVLLAMLSSGLKFDEQITNVARDFGLSHKEASKLRYQMSEIAADSGRVSIQSADIEKSIHNLAKQWGTVGNNLRDDVVSEMAVLGKLTNMSAESQGNFARFANISGKSARVITLETRRAVVNAEQEMGLRVNINEVLDEAGKINGQISAQLGGNVTKIASAITVAKQFGMTLQGVAQAGAALLNFESSISDELEAELLLGKQINLEKARLYALTGDYEGLTKEINANIGDFGDFTKMNVLQQNALAKSVGMTADGLSDVLLKNENIEELAQQARDAGDDDLAKQLERRSNQEKFTDSMDKLKGIFNDIVGGPMGEMLNVIGAIAQGVATVFNGIYGILTLGGLVSDKFVGWLLTLGLMYKAFKMIQGSLFIQQGIVATKLALQGATTAAAVTERGVRLATTPIMARNNGLSLIGLARQVATAAAAGVEMIAKMASGFGPLAPIGAGIAIGVLAASVAAAAAIASGMVSVGDAMDDGKGGFQFSPSVGGIFETDQADQVAIGPTVVDDLNKGMTTISSPTTSQPSIDMSETNNLLNIVASGIDVLVKQPKYESTFSQGNENLSMRAKTVTNQGIIGGGGWSNA